jgi:hypothetical protein
MTTILASPARQHESARSHPNADALAAPRARQAQPPQADPDALNWLIQVCADHLAAAPRPSRAALAAHLVASAGYCVADGFDVRAHNIRVDLATGIAARLIADDPAETGS